MFAKKQIDFLLNLTQELLRNNVACRLLCIMWGREEGEREKDTNTEIFEDGKRENMRESKRERERERDRKERKIYSYMPVYKFESTFICVLFRLCVYVFVCVCEGKIVSQKRK